MSGLRVNVKIFCAKFKMPSLFFFFFYCHFGEKFWEDMSNECMSIVQSSISRLPVRTSISLDHFSHSPFPPQVPF